MIKSSVMKVFRPINPLLSLIATALFLFPSALFSQQHIERGYDAILSQYSKEIVETLSSDSYQGRKAGEPGGFMAACCVSSMLRSCGVAPLVGNSYFQYFRNRRYCSVMGMRNVLGIVRGESDEVVVVGAHYDHLGMIDGGEGDVCYNGADDNASGVSAVLQIAKAVVATGKKPYRSIVFALWDGEEKGMLGSTFFVGECPFMSSVKAYMNFDMIGRGPLENPRHLSYIYTAANSAFGDWLRDDSAKRGFSFVTEYKPWDDPRYGSDNAPFAERRVPVVWYHTEGHPDYHQVSDTHDKIDYEKLIDITRAAFLCVWRLANEKTY